MQTAQGPLTEGVLGLERLLLDSPEFRRRCATETREGLSEHVKLFEYRADPTDLKSARPFAAIWPADELDFDQVAGGAQIYLQPGGTVVLLITDRDRHPGNMGTSGLDFTGWVDRVMADVCRQAGVSDRLPIREIRLQQSPAHSPAKDDPSAGAYWWCAFLIRYD